MSTPEDVALASQKVLEMFVGVCFAPDDLDVATAANQALRDLETMLAELG